MPPYPDWPRLEVAAAIPSTVRRLLDVGCSSGAFAEQMTLRGVEVWGIEPDPEAAGIAQGRMARVIVGQYPDALPSGELFDCISFNDVLEHMVEPKEALLVAKGQLSPGGMVVASIPNVRNIRVLLPLVVHGRWDYADTGLLDRSHLRFFTKATMQELFRDAGYRVRGIQPIKATRMGGKLRALRAMGRHREEFVTEQYLVLADPL